MYEPANDLERKLMRAADDPASRPEFYSALMDADIFVVGFTDSTGDGVTAIPAGTKLSIENWEKNDGTPVIPFFTSLDALRHALKDESRYVVLPARVFFEMTLGSLVMLNPASPYGKEFFPDEIQSLLETRVNHVPETSVAQEESKVLFEQLADANYPSEMVAALTALFERHASVRAAYLCLMHDESISDKPSLVMGLDGENDLTETIQEAGSVVTDTAPPGEAVYFAVLNPNESGISDYMLKYVIPFYERG